MRGAWVAGNSLDNMIRVVVGRDGQEITVEYLERKGENEVKEWVVGGPPGTCAAPWSSVLDIAPEHGVGLGVWAFFASEALKPGV